MLVRCVDCTSLWLTMLVGVVLFVVIIVVRGTVGVAVVAVVGIDEVVASVVTALLETDDAVVAWDTLSVFSFVCAIVSVVSVVGIAVDDAISRNEYWLLKSDISICITYNNLQFIRLF